MQVDRTPARRSGKIISMDVHTEAQRSYNMSRIRSTDTKPEIQIRRLCHKLGYRFRLHRKDLPGKPDLVFPKFKTVIFVNGCFWHRHDCKNGSHLPKSNVEFWQHKLETNKKRDHSNWRKLRRDGWNVGVIWECQTQQPDQAHTRIRSIFGTRKIH